MNNKKYLKLELIVVVLAAALLTNILMIKPIIGVADNGDFNRIMVTTGLQYLTDSDQDRYFGYVNREYRMIPPVMLGGGYFSTEIPMVLLAKLMNTLILPGRTIFDIRFLAAIYSILFLMALYLLVKYLKWGRSAVSWLMAVLAVVLFTDVGYISYFNSLYGEALSFVSLLLTMGMVALLVKQEQPGLWALGGFFAAALLLTGAKAQNAPMGLLLAVFGLGLLRLRKDKRWRRAVVFGSTLLVVTMTVSYASVPDGIRVCNKYQSVFYGILKDSPAPEADLQELGLTEELAVLAGTNYFMQEYPLDIKNPVLLEEISRKVNPFKVAMFYLRHPARFIEKLEIAAENGFQLIQGFGNYEKQEGVEYKKNADSFRLWSNFKQKALPHSLLFVAVFFGVYFALLIFLYVHKKHLRERILLEAFLLIGFTGIIQLVIPIIGDGEADLSKHLFLFNVCFDIMLAFYAFYFLQGMSRAVARAYRAVLTRSGRTTVNE